MERLTKTVALEMADKGIRVNAIAPGAIPTNMNKNILDDDQKKKEEEETSLCTEWSAKRNSQGCIILGIR